jgi:hypothetical protein
MKQNSRALAKTWGWNRYSAYQKEMQLVAAKWFAKWNKKKHPKMPYCLYDHSFWKENIILESVAEFIANRAVDAKGEETFPLHKYLHHGLSSQAMVFNLIGPMIVQKDLSPIIFVLKKKGCKISDGGYLGEFEYADRFVFNENSGQPTSIDLILRNTSGTIDFFIESKFTEAEFGGCSVFSKGDCSGENPIGTKNSCYLSHIGRTYWDKMEKFGFTEHLKGQLSCIFTSYYQFFREILLALEKNGTFVLLCDERSPVFFNKDKDGVDRGLIAFLLKLVPFQHRDCFKVVTIQEIVHEIEVNHKSNHLWVDLFKEKYGIN